VVGVPRRTHGDTGEQKFRDFAERLRQKTCRQVVLWDEAHSTADASRQLRENGTKRREAQREIDMHAAAVILQSYLDDLARRAS
jgi:putative Holliday junction resolvase